MTTALERDMHTLAAWDELFDAEQDMIRIELRSPGYHTTVPDGEMVHPTVHSLDYALLLLQASGSARLTRAQRIIDKVLPLQSLDPYGVTYGTWPWLLEEPVSQMAPPDMNWADFIGARLAIVLRWHEAALDADVAGRVRASLLHAARSMFRRNVQPGYSNIAVMGGWVTAAAGELLDEPWLLAYGRRRLESVVAFINENGSFTEYNSPTYTLVAMVEAERAIQCVSDAPTRAAAEAIRREAWRMVVDHFHPPTAQWAGPHSRAYDDRLTRLAADCLEARLGRAIPAHPDLHEPMNLVPRLDVGCDPLPCPEDMLPRLLDDAKRDQFIRQQFGKMGSNQPCVVGSTWFQGDACLGSANESTTWDQPRPIIGYWRTPHDGAVVFRVRILERGRDFAAGLLRCEQDRHVIHVKASFVPGTGYYHPHFGKPADGVFDVRDLRVRVELKGQGGSAEADGAGRWQLRAAPWRVEMDTSDTPQTIAGRRVAWQSHTEAGHAYVEAVLVDAADEPLRLDPAVIDDVLSFTAALHEDVALPSAD